MWSLSTKWGDKQTLFTSFAFSIAEGEGLSIKCEKPFIFNSKFGYEEVKEKDIPLFETPYKYSFSEFNKNSFIVKFNIRFNHITKEPDLDKSNFEIHLVSKKQMYKDKIHLVKINNYSKDVYDKLKELMTLLFSEGVIRKKVISKRRELSNGRS